MQSHRSAAAGGLAWSQFRRNSKPLRLPGRYRKTNMLSAASSPHNFAISCLDRGAGAWKTLSLPSAGLVSFWWPPN